MSNEYGYWQRFHRERTSRRTMLRAAATGGVGLTGLALVGCGDDDDGSTTPTAPAATPGAGTPTAAPGATEPPAGGLPQGGTLRLSGGVGDITTLDSHLSLNNRDDGIFFPLYDGLLYVSSEDWSPVPQLAHDFEVVDPMTVVFNLREDALFHDGTPFDSAAARLNWERYTSEELAAGIRDDVPWSDWEAVGPHTLRVTTTDVFAPLLSRIFFRHGLMLSPQTLDRPFTEQLEPVAAGPFRLGSRQVGVSVTLERFDDYYDPGRAHADEIQFTFFADQTTVFNELRTGGLDIAQLAEKQFFDAIVGDDNFETMESTANTGRQLIFNATQGVFADENVRKAVSYAIDREAIVEAVQFGGEALTNPILDTSWAFNSDVNYYEYNPEEARALLSAAGLEEFSFVCPAYTGPVAQVGEAMQAQLAAVGITMDLQPADEGAVVGRLISGDYDAALLNFDQAPDPDDWFARQGIVYLPFLEGLDAHLRHNETELTTLIERAQATIDQDERQQHYWDAIDIIGERMLNAGIVQAPLRLAWSKRVKNVRLWADRRIHAEELAIEP